MKKIFFILVCCSLAFSQELLVSIFYSDSQDLQCNSYKTQISTILDNRFLKTQNPIFETTYFQKDSSIKQHYNLQGKCNLVVSFLQEDKEKAYKVLNLDTLHFSYFFQPDSKLQEINKSKLLLGIWGFIFKNSNAFSAINIVLAFLCGFISAFFYKNANPTSPLTLSILWLIAFLSIGFVFSLIFMPSLYPVRKNFSALVAFPALIMTFLLLYTSPKIYNIFFNTPLGNISPLSILIPLIAFLYSNKIENFLSFTLGFMILTLIKSDFIFQQKIRNMILKLTALAILCFGAMQCLLFFNLFIGILLAILQCLLFVLALIGFKNIK